MAAGGCILESMSRHSNHYLAWMNSLTPLSVFRLSCYYTIPLFISPRSIYIFYLFPPSFLPRTNLTNFVCMYVSFNINCYKLFFRSNFQPNNYKATQNVRDQSGKAWWGTLHGARVISVTQQEAQTLPSATPQPCEKLFISSFIRWRPEGAGLRFTTLSFVKAMMYGESY